MKMYLSHALFATAALCAIHCAEHEIEFKTLEKDCTNKCRIVSFVCDNAGSDPNADQEGCIDECLGWGDDSREQGRECAESYERMLICVGKLDTCEEIFEWALRSPTSPCTPDAKAFDSACEDF